VAAGTAEREFRQILSSRPKSRRPDADIDPAVCIDFDGCAGRNVEERRTRVTKTTSKIWLKTTLAGLGLGLAAISSTGCQGTYAGQTLPSAYYIQDDISYHAPGPEFKLAREAAAQKAYKADLEAQQRGQ
jgi:hypothetical protein